MSPFYIKKISFRYSVTATESKLGKFTFMVFPTHITQLHILITLFKKIYLYVRG